jgi:diguanylate cyclase (GGDEF)-like protein
MTIAADDLRARFERFRRLIEAKEYYAVGASRRFLADERRKTLGAARVAMLVVAVAVPVHILVLTILHPAAAPLIVLIDGGLGAIALASWWALGRRLRHHPEPVAAAVTLLVAVASMVLALVGPKLVLLAVAYVTFLPTLVALVIPWRTWTHIRWLALYGAIVISFLVLVPDTTLAPIDRRDLVFAQLVVIVASFVGHVLVFRQQIRTFIQVQSIVRLHRRENSQRVELERVYRSLEITARTDELTRVGNRMRLEEDLVALRGRIGRSARPAGLLEVDLDHFKAVNDGLGHLAGDAVLREVARCLRETVRSDDAVYRYGGEEFLIILGNVAGGVEGAGERVRAAVEALGMSHPDNAPFDNVTISVGATALDPADLDLTADQWFARVDRALYEAKAAGRNRVAVALAADGGPDRSTAGSGVTRLASGTPLGRSA